jgi:hypothetical protein
MLIPTVFFLWRKNTIGNAEDRACRGVLLQEWSISPLGYTFQQHDLPLGYTFQWQLANGTVKHIYPELLRCCQLGTTGTVYLFETPLLLPYYD